ncbi:MAG: hypothetical protein JRN68_08680 [Nitrososphaerota archaeon]|jgi:hypothetical protein|nr:hypothetical protein [Nitrososphaerota archaeon]
MPICPKCHKEISDRKFERHLRRCGESHKQEAAPLSAPSATPSFYWGDYHSGYHEKGTHPEQRRGSGKRLVAYLLASVLIIVIILVVLGF